MSTALQPVARIVELHIHSQLQFVVVLQPTQPLQPPLLHIILRLSFSPCASSWVSDLTSCCLRRNSSYFLHLDTFQSDRVRQKGISRPRARLLRSVSVATSSGTQKMSKVGYRMPAEWEEHQGCWMGWPDRPDNWRNGAAPAQDAFVDVATAISSFEPVTVCANPAQWKTARTKLPAHVRVVEMVTNDSWFRDTGPTFVYQQMDSNRATKQGKVVGIDWLFNGWGKIKEYNSELDQLVAWKICEMERIPRASCDMVLEGGSIHIDGEGTLLTTEECLLNPNRNPGLSKEQIEAHLREMLGVSAFLWLPEGLYGDTDTDGHIDNMAAFARPGVVLLSWTDDKQHPQYQRSLRALQVLEESVDAKGRKVEVIKLPMPPQQRRSKEEVAGLVGWQGSFLKGRDEGEVLAASYANFYIANGGIVMPAFGVATDAEAQAVMRAAFPGREVVAVPSREILLGGGNIHCITCQQPAGSA